MQSIEKHPVKIGLVSLIMVALFIIDISSSVSEVKTIIKNDVQNNSINIDELKKRQDKDDERDAKTKEAVIKMEKDIEYTKKEVEEIKEILKRIESKL